MPIWLAFDAGSPVTSAVVARDAEVIAASSGESRTGPSLLQHIETVRSQAGIPLGALDGIVVLSGPGSFTGIRVALATALGLRAALAVPVVALSNLAALALHAEPPDSPVVVALVDALRDEWFVQEFRRDGIQLVAIRSPLRTAAPDLAAPPGALVAIHQTQPVPAALAALPVRRAQDLAAAVAAAASAGRLQHLLTAALDPLYLRAFTPRNPQV